MSKVATLPMYDKNPFKILFSETSRLMAFELGTHHQGGGGGGATKFVQMMILG